MKKYIRKNGKLSRADTDKLFKLFYEDKENGINLEDSIYRTILICANEPLIKHLILQRNKFVDDDLFSIGKIGLIKAVDNYDINSNNIFSTFASICIKNEIGMSFRKQRPDTTSFEEVVFFNNKGSGDILLEDVLESDEDFVEEIGNEDFYKHILEKICYLPPLTQYVLLSQIGYYDKFLVQEEIAEKLNFHRSYMSRIMTAAIKNLKILISNPQELSDKDFDTFIMLTENKYGILTKEEYENFPNTFKLERENNKST